MSKEALSVDLMAAWQEGRQLSAAGYTVADEAAAYAVQDGIAEALGWHANGRPQFWKSGGASRTAGLSHAPLAPQGVRAAGASFADVPLHNPLAEAEIALRVDAAGRIDAMCLSMELVSSRWLEGTSAPPLLRLADFGLHGALALGEWLPFEPGRDWAAQVVSIQVNDGEPLRGRGCHALGDPAWLLEGWAAHAMRGGRVLPGGSVVTTGAWLVQPGLKRGDRVTVSFDGLGSLSATV